MVDWIAGAWTCRKSHLITASAGAGTNYQVKITVHYADGADSGGDVYCNSKCRTDFGDIRFTDNDGSTELDYWMESKVDSNNAVFWVEVRDTLESDATIYVYYNNAAQTTTSNGDNTFPFFDDFEDSSIDTNKWTTYGTAGKVTETGGNLVLTSSGVNAGAKGKTNFNTGYALRTKSKLVSGLYGWMNCWSLYPTQLTDYILAWENLGSPNKWQSGTGKNGSADLWLSAISADNNFHIWESRRISTSSSKVLIDDGAFHEHVDSADIPTIDLPANFYTAGSPTSVINIDWCLFRKCIATEPAHSTWGGSEIILQSLTETLTKTSTVLGRFGKSLSCVLGLSNNASTDYISGAITRTLSEALTMVNVITNKVSKSLVQTLTLTGVQTKVWNFYKDLVSTLNISDVVDESLYHLLNLSLTSIFGMNDEVSYLRTFGINLTESMSSVGIVTLISNFVRSFNETLGSIGIIGKNLNRSISSFLGFVSTPTSETSKSLIETLGLSEDTILQTAFHITGITRNTLGIALGGCIVLLYKTGNYSYISSQVSDANTGLYSFDVTDTVTEYFVCAFKTGSQPVQGITNKDLKGE